MSAAAPPAPNRTAIASSDATGDVRYRGYDPGDLAASCSFLEVAYLLAHGDLPSPAESAAWIDEVTHHTMVHEQLRRVIEGFPTDAPPRAIWSSAVAGLAALYPDAAARSAPADRRLQIARLLGKGPTIAADAFRHRHGFPAVLPDNSLSYAGDLLSLIFRRAEPRFRPHRALERALDAWLIAQAEPAADVATHTVRLLSGAHGNPYWAVAAASTACGCACAAGTMREALAFAHEVSSGRSVEAVADEVQAAVRLAGFERRSGGPSGIARALKAALHEALAATGPRPLVDAGLRLEAAIEGEPGLGLVAGRDFFSALIFDALHLEDELLEVLLAIARTAGWAAHWNESVASSEPTPALPVLEYTGPAPRHVAPRGPAIGPTARDEGGMEDEMVSV